MKIFSRKFLIFFLFLFKRGEAVLTSTHNLCFGAKIRKLCISLHTPFFFFYVKVGFKGVYIARTYYPDVKRVYPKIRLLDRNLHPTGK